MSEHKSACDGCSRRTLLKGLGLAALAPLAVNALGGCQQGANIPNANTTACGANTCIDLGDPANAALATVGGALLFDTSSDTIIVIRTTTADVIALSAICTHAGCIVDYNGGSQHIDCNCHGSEFSQTGSVLRGPARSPLRAYTAMLAGTTITVAA